MENLSLILNYLLHDAPEQLDNNKFKLIIVVLLISVGLNFSSKLQLTNSQPLLSPEALVETARSKDTYYVVLSFPYDPVNYPDALWGNLLKGVVESGVNNDVNVFLTSGRWEAYEDRVLDALESNNQAGLIINTLHDLSAETIRKLKKTKVVVIDEPQELFPTITVDYVSLGYNLTKDLNRFLPNKKAIVLTGIPGTKMAELRLRGIRAGLKKSSIQIVAEISAWWRKQDAKVRMVEIIKNYPEVKLIISSNDEMSYGVLEVIEDLQLKDYVVVNFDFIGDTSDLINAGLIFASVDTYSYERGYYSIETIVNQNVRNKKILPMLDTAITKHNLNQYLLDHGQSIPSERN